MVFTCPLKLNKMKCLPRKKNLANIITREMMAVKEDFTKRKELVRKQ